MHRPADKQSPTLPLVLPEDASIGNVLGSLGVAADFINSQTDGASTNYASQGGPWAGALSTLVPGKC